ncbi:MAG: hypothetical protein Tsb0021_12770 [Chlamydiales bacterium]
MNLEEQMIKTAQQMGEDHSETVGKGIKKLAENVEHNAVIPKEALGISDEAAERIYAQAFQLYNMGKYKEAQKLFISLTLLNAMETKYILGLAACAHMMKDHEQAVNHYLKCGMMDPKSPIPFYHASDCFIQLNDIYSTMICLNTVIKRAGEKPEFEKMKNRAEATLKTLEEKLKKGETSLEDMKGSPKKNEPELDEEE